MLHNSIDPQFTEATDVQRQDKKRSVKRVCNGCNVTMFFDDHKDYETRKYVAELLVTAFERQIGVKETV